MGIAAKIWAGISVLIFAYVFSNVRNLWGVLHIERRIEDVASVSIPVSRMSQGALNHFETAVKACEDAVILGHPDSVQEAEQHFEQAAEKLDAISQVDAFARTHRRTAERLRDELVAYYEEALPLYERMSEGDEDEDLMQDVAEAGVLMRSLRERLDALQGSIDDELLNDLNSALAQSRQWVQINLILFVGVMVVSIILVTLTIKRWIIRQIKGVVAMANQLAEGYLPESLPGETRDEIGELERAFNRMADANRRIVHHVRRLAQGDYETDLAPRSEKDELTMALIRMTDALKLFNEDSSRQNWLKGGMSELSNRMRGEQDMQALCDHVLHFVALYVGAHIGILYLVRDDETLVAGAGFGFHEEPEEPLVVRWGVGLVGEAAARKQSYSMMDIDEPAMQIHLGYCRIAPRHIIAYPLVYQDEVVGVIELGGVQPFHELTEEFLCELAEPVAITLRSAQARLKVRELLSETQRQSNELQHQQEELQQTNVELEERTELLEKQKQEIRRQNKDLEAARLDMERKARDLEQANKYKSEFLANMSHELRTPLNSLLILSRLLAENKGGNLTEKQVEFARTINKSGSDLLTLINDILDLSKVEAGKMEFHIEDISVQQLCKDVKTVFDHVAVEKKLDFVLDVAEDAPGCLRTDGQRIGQVLRNLLANAFKFTSEGRVRINVHVPDPEEAGFKEAAIAFAIEDSGIGIPEAKRKQIFNAFQQADGTTSRKYGGTGLGLSISREFAMRLGGRIAVASEDGKGSTFTLILPLAAPGEEPPAEAPPPKKEPPAARVGRDQAGHQAAPAPAHASLPAEASSKVFVEDDRGSVQPGERVVLIIEDDPKFAGILVAFAHEKDCKAIATDNGEEGLVLAERYQPVGVILDMMLPGMDGRDVLGRLKESSATRHIPVHIVSALDEDKQVFRLGAIGFLTKPVSPEQLQDVFSQFDGFRENGFRRLMLVEDDEGVASSLAELLADLKIETEKAASGAQALALLDKEQFDCIILDLGLPDMTGAELLERMMERKDPRHIPLIIHTGRDLTREEEAHLRQFSESIIIKGAYSAHRLLDEVALFLHVVRQEDEDAMTKPQEPITSTVPEPEPEPEPSAPQPASTVVQEDLKGRKALIVDDDMRNAYSLTAVFDGEGMDYLVAADGQAAIDTLRENSDIDIVLMDIMMPGMDGFETIAKIRTEERFKEIPIIALTAKAMKGDREKCIESGANDYLPKPIDTDKLLSMMRTWMHR